MEEEDIRIAHGEVTEADQVPIVSKANQPNFVSQLFPVPSQYEQPNLEDGLPVQTNIDDELMSPLGAADEEAPARRDSDSDEGIEAEKSTESPKHNDGPTEAQVDAALAELDSLPGEDSSEDDAEWVYTKPEEQTVENENVKIEADKPVTSAPTNLEELPAVTPLDIPIDSAPKSIEVDQTLSPVSPQRSSPRTVEGFITSVELNTPEETFNTNLTINQSTDFFAEGTAVEQSSGPFSVYVSSSPEPASMETAPVQLQSPIDDSTTDTHSNSEMLISTGQDEPKTDNVEIVHAQSMVEVTASSVLHSEFQPMPDIMTQSFTGDQLPEQPYNPEEVVASMTESMTELSMDAGHEVSGLAQFSGHLEKQQEESLESPSFDQQPAMDPLDFTSVKPGEPLLATQEFDPISQVSEKESTLNEANILADEPMLSSGMKEQHEDVLFKTVTEDEFIPEDPEVTNKTEAIVEDTLITQKAPEVTENVVDDLGEAVEDTTLSPEPVLVTEKVASEPMTEVKEPESDLVTPTNTPKQPPKPAARTTSLKTSSRTPISRLSKGTSQPPPKLGAKTTARPATKPEEKKPAVPKARDSAKPAPRVAAAKPSPKPTSTTRAPLSKPTLSSTSSRLATKKATTTTVPSKTSSPASRPTSASTAKRVPLSARTTSATKPGTSSTSTTRTTTTTTRRPISAPRPTATSLARTMPATKDTKNTTNKLISSRPSIGLASSRTTTTGPAKTRTPTNTKTTTTTTARRPITNTKTNITGIKSKIDTGRSASKTVKSVKQETVSEKTAEVNGENKIVEEESSIEVKEKLIEEKQANVESNQEVIVNGNH